MFERAVLENVRYELTNSALSDVIPNEAIIITAEDSPPPSVGQYFVLIYGSSRTNLVASQDPVNNTIQDRFMFNIVCGARTRLAPNDRRGYYLSKEHESLQVIKDLVITVVSRLGSANNNSIYTEMQNLLNSYPSTVKTLLTQNVNIVQTYEFLEADSDPIPRFADYFTSTDQIESQSTRPAGHTLTCRFNAPVRIYRNLC